MFTHRPLIEDLLPQAPIVQIEIVDNIIDYLNQFANTHIEDVSCQHHIRQRNQVRFGSHQSNEKSARMYTNVRDKHYIDLYYFAETNIVSIKLWKDKDIVFYIIKSPNEVYSIMPSVVSKYSDWFKRKVGSLTKCADRSNF